ncbi:hypothetical protein A5906_35490 [Bradyrhizobium sacchari]|uniref:hypothetical protein n=1 Tax=Bradyrhizobium sacchari TaxID=1399419 RepID=UPI0009C49CB0|nr:hypothetical protein [Bradyrhizobium sacchari]OPY97583.1 hypothetical protein A5906_35490 [Bradyrhizobium sacchari]
MAVHLIIGGTPTSSLRRQRPRRAMLTIAKRRARIDEFYATLSSEQRARFDALQQAASPEKPHTW